MFDFDYLFEWRLRLNEITSNYVHILDALVGAGRRKSGVVRADEGGLLAL